MLGHNLLYIFSKVELGLYRALILTILLMISILDMIDRMKINYVEEFCKQIPIFDHLD